LLTKHSRNRIATTEIRRATRPAACSSRPGRTWPVGVHG